MPIAPPATFGRENSFTFLRLVFALAVVVGHCWALGGLGEEPLSRLTRGVLSGRELAVQGFFVLSGFFIAKSLAENPSLWRFACHRAFRILPAFWVCLGLMVFVLAPWFIALRWPDRFSYGQRLTLGPWPAWNYFLHNWALQGDQYQIAPLFAGNPVRFDVNGSLWSVFLEAQFYLYAAAAAGARRLPVRAALLGALLAALAVWTGGWIVAGFCAAVCVWRALVPAGRGAAVLFAALYALHAVLAFAPDALQFLPLRLVVWLLPVMTPDFRLVSALAFLGGTLCWRYRAQLRWEKRWFFLALAVLAAGVVARQWVLVMPLALPYAVLFLGLRLPFEKAGRWGDFSYGIYLFSFPLQQVLIWAGLARAGLPALLAASLALSLAVGVASWFCVEKPALRLGRRLGAWQPAFSRRRTAAPIPAPTPPSAVPALP